jgi:hypothetical protein
MNIIKSVKAALIAIVFIAASVVQTQAAEITLANDNFGIILDGPILPGDYEKLVALIKENPERRGLILNSGGGHALVGFKIGKFVKQNKMKTLVPNGAYCASACAFIWIAGEQKYWGESGQIFFHGVYSAQGEPTNNPTVFPEDIGLTGYYMGDIGASLSLTLAIINQTSPTTFITLTPQMALFYGIKNVIMIKKEQPKPKSKPQG